MVLIALALGFGAVRLRARLVPGWTGPPARLAEIVLGLSLLTVSLQLLGTIGLLEFAPLLILSLADRLRAHRRRAPTVGWRVGKSRDRP